MVLCGIDPPPALLQGARPMTLGYPGRRSPARLPLGCIAKALSGLVLARLRLALPRFRRSRCAPKGQRRIAQGKAKRRPGYAQALGRALQGRGKGSIMFGASCNGMSSRLTWLLAKPELIRPQASCLDFYYPPE